MFFVFYFIKISKFALPGVMLIYERTSKDRKKDKKSLVAEFYVAICRQTMAVENTVSSDFLSAFMRGSRGGGGGSNFDNFF